MNKEFVTYEQALALKELGFNEKCMASDYYADGKILIEYPEDGITNTEHDKLTEECNDEFDEIGEDKIEYGATIPLYQQAFRWFREKHSFIGISTISNYSDDRYVFDIFQKGNEEIYFEGSDLSDRNNGNKEYNTYEEAESACLDKLIEIVKNKQDE
jgi:hypothetical protein